MTTYIAIIYIYIGIMPGIVGESINIVFNQEIKTVESRNPAPVGRFLVDG